MKREALRTESETSQSVTSLGFSRWRLRNRSSMGTPPYWRLFLMVRRESGRPFASWRWRRARASLILRARRAAPPLLFSAPSRGGGAGVFDFGREPRDHRLHRRDLVRREREERLVCQHLARELLALPVGPALELALDVLADHAPERFQAQVEVVADPREHARVHALGLEELHDAREVALDGLPVDRKSTRLN